MKTAFLITARLKSTRLPKKITLEIMGKPLIVHMLDRIKHTDQIGKIIICTSTNPQDDPLEEIAAAEGVHCYRGSENDVLIRLLGAAHEHELDHFANITADCPMIDPILIDRAIKEYYKISADLIMYDDSKNDLPFNCYVIKTSALKKVCDLKKETDTEVWLRYFQSLDDFHIHTIYVEDKYRHISLKTSIDYPEDYEFMKKVFEELYKAGEVFSLLDIIDLVTRQPDVLSINASPALVRRWRGHQSALT